MKRKGLLLFLGFITLALILFPESNIQSGKAALTLCFTSVIPSLFPFFVLCRILIDLGAAELLGKYTGGFMKKLFHYSRRDRIRTCGLYVPNVALYQAEPHAVIRWAQRYAASFIKTNPLPRLTRNACWPFAIMPARFLSRGRLVQPCSAASSGDFF